MKMILDQGRVFCIFCGGDRFFKNSYFKIDRISNLNIFANFDLDETCSCLVIMFSKVNYEHK